MPHLTLSETDGEKIIPLDAVEILIGRSHTCAIKLSTEQASRTHCKIVRSEAGFKIVDLESSNGTFLNGVKVTEQELRDGDAITIGHTTLRYSTLEPPSPSSSPSDVITAPIPLNDRNVQILLDTIISATSTTDLGTFLTLALDNVIETVDAERAVLFFREEGHLKIRLARDHRKHTLQEVEAISQSIPRQVLQTRRAVYVMDSEQSASPEALSRSVSLYQLHTIMCAPLRVGEKMLGVLYVDSHAKGHRYSATDLAVFEAVANYLALTIENVRSAQEAKAREAERRKSLERELATLRSALEKRRHVIGSSPPMRQIYEVVRKVAPTDATVLILGESGTGKEAVAHAIHDLSHRSVRPFVVIDATSIPETLLESELFGYERGAFTGAESQKPGKLESAEGGTVFLDEIGELSPALQAKLLRALEQRMFMRVGGIAPVAFDARIIAATNRPLESWVKEGRFRQDLYFRLNVVTMTLPPLRERGDDILLLARHFLEEAGTLNHRPVKDFSEEAKAALLHHRWDGNIRELKNRIEQAVILSNKDYLSTEDLNLPDSSSSVRSLQTAREHFERAYIAKALALHHGNVTHTAKALGISRQHLQNLVKKLNLGTKSEES